MVRIAVVAAGAHLADGDHDGAEQAVTVSPFE
jgi:hypothetical protein